MGISQKYKLSEIGFLGRGKSKYRPRDASHLYGGLYPFIQTGDVKNANHKLYNYTQTYSEAGLAQSKLWPEKTICITIAANIAETAILTFRACFPDSVIGLVVDESKFNVDYIEYMLQYFKLEVQKHSIGSVQENINLGTFENITFPIPDLEIQTHVASILSSLDDKIELNRRMNRTLEQMAQALFNHYFVDAVDETNLNEVGLLDIATLFGGGTPKTSVAEYWDGTVFWISGKDVTPNNRTFILETERKITAQGLQNSNAKLLPAFSTVITARGTVGNVCLLPTEMAISQSNYALKSKVGCHFVLFQVIQQKLDELKRNSYGTVFDTITTNTIRDIKVLVPDVSRVNKLEEMLKPLYQKMLSNLNENTSLCKIRDTLLPKLMSGEIDVDELMNEELMAEECNTIEVA